MRPLIVLGVVVLSLGCPPEPPPPEAPDAGPTFVTCDSPEDCVQHRAVCRQAQCEADAPCGDDLECGLGERCVAGQCRFTGCTDGASCASGFCDLTTFSCAECGDDAQCPSERPVCDRGLRQCVQCRSDAQCQPPGPAHCSVEGRCVGCLVSAHCPPGLFCASGNVCVGASANAPCPMGVACGADLVCVNVNASPVCLASCALYEPDCAAGQLCYGLTYSASTSFVFEASGPIGVCFSPQAGQRGLREPCVRTPTGNNCQPNLQCVPDTATLALCRAYCNPLASGSCPVGERCATFVGDYAGREYGVCLADNGFGQRCTNDSVCRAGLSCTAWDDPSDTDLVSGVCQFALGDGGVGAPCSTRVLSDGGVLAAERQCRSGQCVSDPLVVAPAVDPYFCFGACERDGDCGDAGVCDAEFNVTTAYGTQGLMRGCRPTCTAEADCAVYGAGIACRARVVGSASAPVFSSTCSPPAGAGRAGEACTVNSQCRSNLCVLDDSRGVRRAGVCATFCDDVSACDGDAGLPLACQPTTYLVSRGFDGVAVTADDQLAVRSSCSGVSCRVDGDCEAGVCSLQRDPLNGAQVVPRCAPRTLGTKHGGEACVLDTECTSGVCGQLQHGRACFEACDATSTCPASTTCRVGALAIALPDASVLVDSCAP